MDRETLQAVLDEMNRRWGTPAFTSDGGWRGLRDWLTELIDAAPTR